LLIGEGDTTFMVKDVAVPAISYALDDLLDLELSVSSDTDLFFMTV